MAGASDNVLEVLIRFRTEIDDAVKKIQGGTATVGKSLDDLKETGVKGSSVFSLAFDKIKNGILSFAAPIKILDLVSSAFGRLVGLLEDSVVAFARQEVVTARLRAEVDRLGGSWEQFGPLVGAASEELKKLGITNTEVESGIAQLTTLNFGLRDSLTAIRGAAKLSVIEGQSLSASILELTRAARGFFRPGSELGLILADVRQELEKGGDVTENLNLVLERLKNLEPSVTAQTRTMSGAWKELRATLDNATDSLGGFISRALHLPQLTRALTGIVGDLAPQEALDPLQQKVIQIQKNILEIESALRKGFNDPKLRAALDRLRSDLVVAETEFTEKLNKELARSEARRVIDTVASLARLRKKSLEEQNTTILSDTVQRIGALSQTETKLEASRFKTLIANDQLSLSERRRIIVEHYDKVLQIERDRITQQETLVTATTTKVAGALAKALGVVGPKVQPSQQQVDALIASVERVMSDSDGLLKILTQVRPELEGVLTTEEAFAPEKLISAGLVTEIQTAKELSRQLTEVANNFTLAQSRAIDAKTKLDELQSRKLLTQEEIESIPKLEAQMKSAQAEAAKLTQQLLAVFEISVTEPKQKLAFENLKKLLDLLVQKQQIKTEKITLPVEVGLQQEGDLKDAGTKFLTDMKDKAQVILDRLSRQQKALELKVKVGAVTQTEALRSGLEDRGTAGVQLQPLIEAGQTRINELKEKGVKLTVTEAEELRKLVPVVEGLRADFEGLKATLSEQIDATDDFGEGFKLAIDRNKTSLKSFGSAGADTFDKLNDGIAEFGSELATQPAMWANAGAAARQFFSQLLQQIAQAIVKMIILRILSSAFSSGAGAASQGGVVVGGASRGAVIPIIPGYVGGGVGSGLIRTPSGIMALPRTPDDKYYVKVRGGEPIIAPEDAEWAGGAHQVFAAFRRRLIPRDFFRHVSVTMPAMPRLAFATGGVAPTIPQLSQFGSGSADGGQGTSAPSFGAQQPRPIVLKVMAHFDDRARREFTASSEFESGVLAIMRSNPKQIQRSTGSASGFNEG